MASKESVYLFIPVIQANISIKEQIKKKKKAQKKQN